MNTETLPQERIDGTNNKSMIRVEDVNDSLYIRQSKTDNWKHIQNGGKNREKFLKLWADLLKLQRESDLDYAGLSQNYCRVTVQNNGRQIVMRSSHINAEKNPNVVATESGLSIRGDDERLSSRSADSMTYKNFRHVFDGFYQLCKQ